MSATGTVKIETGKMRINCIIKNTVLKKNNSIKISFDQNGLMWTEGPDGV